MFVESLEMERDPQQPKRKVSMHVTDPQRDHIELVIRPQTVATVLLVIAGFVLAGYAFTQVTRVLVWLLTAAFLALALDPAIRRLEGHGMRRGAALGIVIFSLFALLAGAMFVIVPPLVQQVQTMETVIPDVVTSFTQLDFMQWLDQRFDIIDKLETQVDHVPAAIAEDMSGIFTSIASGIVGALAILAVTILLLVYGEGLVRESLRLMPSLGHHRSWEIIERAYTGVSAYVFGTVSVALIAGSVMLVLLLVLGVPLAFPLALWVAFTAIVPVLGAMLGAIPAILVATADEPWKGVAVIVAMIVYQQIESIILQPAIIGRVVQLSPLVVFVAFLLGADLLGIVGAILAVPAAATLQIALQQQADQREADHPERVGRALERLDGPRQDPADPAIDA